MSSAYILVVDDEPDIRELVREILEDEHYEVGTAENGERGARVVVRLPLCQGQTSLASITRTPQAPSAKEWI